MIFFFFIWSEKFRSHNIYLKNFQQTRQNIGIISSVCQTLLLQVQNSFTIFYQLNNSSGTQYKNLISVSGLGNKFFFFVFIFFFFLNFLKRKMWKKCIYIFWVLIMFQGAASSGLSHFIGAASLGLCNFSGFIDQGKLGAGKFLKSPCTTSN